MRMKVSIRDWDQQMPPLIYSKGQQGSTVQHKKLYSMSCEKPQRKRGLKKRMYTCITEALCCTAETNNIVNQLHFKFKKQITESRKSKKKCSTRRRKERKTDKVKTGKFNPGRATFLCYRADLPTFQMSK